MDQWSLDTVRGILALGIFESEIFDLKVMLPPNDKGKQRLRKACAAFANSHGGFLVFGVSDASGAGLTDRMVGMDSSLAFPTTFGSFPAECEPSVVWTFKNPPIVVESTKVIHVVQIPPSWQAPHAVASHDGWVFPKRTSKGIEPMSFAEVRQAFLGYYEKRLKLQLLRAELVQLTQVSQGIALAREELPLAFSVLPVLELRVIETVLSDTYSILHANQVLLARLAQLRPIVQHVNAYTETLRVSIAVHPEFGVTRMRTYLPALQSHQMQIKSIAEEAIAELDKFMQSA